MASRAFEEFLKVGTAEIARVSSGICDLHDFLVGFTGTVTFAAVLPLIGASEVNGVGVVRQRQCHPPRLRLDPLREEEVADPAVF